MIKKINPFVIIVDNEGDVIDVTSINTSIDTIFEYLRINDNKHSSYAPHRAFECKDGEFTLIKDDRQYYLSLK